MASEDADVLRRMFVKGLAFGGSSGGASILDLHSGALSKDDRFINIKKLKVRQRLAAESSYFLKNIFSGQR